MFRITRTRPTVVRILDVPIKMTIEPNFIITPIDGDKVMIIYGDFEHVKDSEAFRIIQAKLDKIAS